jgi:DNA-binding transcriptional MerR regulator
MLFGSQARRFVMTVLQEREHVQHMVSQVNELDEIASTLDDAATAQRLRSVSEAIAAEIAPVRVVIAAEVLGVSEKTVRSWVREGVLVKAGAHRRVLLDPAGLIAVERIVEQLRANGRDRNLLDAVYYELVDNDLANSSDLRDSLAQAKRREGHQIA